MKLTNNQETNGAMNTIIGRDTTITGTLDVKGSLRVDGSVHGKIICSDCVTIGTTGKVEAEIESATAIVAGHMSGNVVTTDKIELQANCHMDGDLRTKSLVIEEGAVFCGACNMKNTSPNLDFLKEGRTQKAPVPDNKEK
ncbi:MAG: polymer-forming cytoskeletal protein [bacterium]